MKKKRCVLYLRYSSVRQREESIEAQERICSAFACGKGYDIVSVYADKELSGTSDEREQFIQMISDAEKKMFDVVVCHKIDRFARDRYDYAIYKKKLNRCKVSIEYAEQDVGSSPEGIILESVLVGMAEYFSRNLARETRKGLDQNAINSKSTGGKLPIGYMHDKNGNIVIDPISSKIVIAMFSDRRAGMSYGTMSKKYDMPISTVKYVLSNEKYFGRYSYGKRTKIAGKMVCGSFPAIMEEAVR